MTTWLITGCSSGLGRALALAALRQGHHVAVTARDAATLDELTAQHPEHSLALTLDITRRSDIVAALAAAESRLGGIDVLVNNAGYGYRAAVEEGEEAAVRQLFETHVFGPAHLIQAVLPGMRRRRAGTVVNVSSIGARTSPPGSGYYAAAKAALEALTLSLRREVEPLGISAMVVEPGAFRTGFTGTALAEAPDAIADYAETSGRRRRSSATPATPAMGDPDKAAQVLLRVVESPHPPFLLPLGPDAVEAVTDSIRSLAHEVDQWARLARTTDFDAT